MKIAIVTNNYRPYAGGVVSSIDNFAKYQIRLGHQVKIITLDFDGSGNEESEGLSIIRLPSPIRFNYRTLPIAIPWLPQRALLQALQAMRPDIIHSQHPFLLGVAALKIGRQLKIPVIFTYHSKYERFAHWVPLPQGWAESFIRQSAISYCNAVDGIVAPSRAIQEYLQSNGCTRMVQVIPSGILPLYLESPRQLKVKQDQFQLLTVSRFAKEKNIPFLLRVFSHLSHDFCLTLVGYGPELPALRDLAYNVLGLDSKQVRFVERPSKLDLLNLYQAADLFIFASTAETQGLVLAEAMACGTPVVALNGPGQSDLIVNGENGFLVNSEKEMAEIIQLIANSIELHLHLQTGAYQASQSYHPAKLTQSLIQFYQNFCKG